MKSIRVLGLVLLMCGAAGIAKADGGDPVLTTNKFPDPSCSPAPAGDTCFSANSQADPVFFVGTADTVTPPENFLWDGTGDLTSLFVEFTFIPGESYNCASNIYASCGVVAPSIDPETDLEFKFTGADLTHPGFIAPCTNVDGVQDCEGFTASFVGVPEPGSGLLLFAGLISVVALARKRLMKQITAAQQVLSA
ncbi:MAG TPA: PEP-CTERM sorting domain-containing protein [Candidatus Acidoferrales bacterium]